MKMHKHSAILGLKHHDDDDASR